MAIYKGSIGIGILIGFLLIALIGWTPIFGPLIIFGSFIGGLAAGVIARGAWRGAFAGLVTGIIGATILGIVIMVFLSSSGTNLGGFIAAAARSTLSGDIIGLSRMGVSALLIAYSLTGAVLSTIGGIIGGEIAHRRANA